MDFDEVLKVLGSLEKHGVEYVLIGGIAVSFHGIPRATEDIDLFIRCLPDNMARLRQALKDVYQDPAIDEIRDEDLAGEYPTVRYVPPHGTLIINLLGRLGEFEGYADLGIEEVEIQGVKVRIASPETLYWLKKDTLRPIDRADAEALKEKFHLQERSKDGPNQSR